MNNHQNEKYSVFQQILLFLAAYTDAFVGNTQLLAAILKFKGFIDDIDAVSAKKQLKASVPQTKKKDATRKSLVAMLEAACLLALEWAKAQKDEQLIKDFTINETSLKGKINQMLILANYTFGVLNTNKTALIAATTITAPQLLAIQTEIELLETLQKAPAAARSAQKTVTALYKPAFLDAIAGKETIINLVKGAYTIGAKANLEMILDLENALVFGGNVQHTVLNAKFYTAGTTTRIEGAVITIIELKRVGVSNIYGDAYIKEFKPGTYHVTFSALDHISQTRIIPIPAGGKVSEIIMLVGS